jgi:hypothetical protein
VGKKDRKWEGVRILGRVARKSLAEKVFVVWRKVRGGL